MPVAHIRRFPVRQMSGNGSLFLGSLYTVALITATATVIHLLCRIRTDWDEHDFYIAMANWARMSPRHLKQLKFFLLIAACFGLVCSAFRVLPSLW